MKTTFKVFLISTMLSSPILAQDRAVLRDELAKTILFHDSLFWEAYNACDVEKMGVFFTDDMEFYHDKGGLTDSKEKFVAMTRSGLCGSTDWKLRREVVAGSLKVYPLENYGAILSGEHLFYVREKGKDERLDGHARFTHVWRLKDNAWKMHRVLSYDHGPASYVNKRTEIDLPADVLNAYAGQYTSARAGILTVNFTGRALALQGASFSATIYPESKTLFFMKERDLQFEFVEASGKITMLRVYEHGEVVEEAPRASR